ncbi:hypothetical protein U3516DRAFT_550340 [Neocallimastix sp. 'constans']
MFSIGNKYFKLICVALILFGINITKVLASDCDIFKNSYPYMSEEYVQKFKNKVDCCNVEENIIECENGNIVAVNL